MGIAKFARTKGAKDKKKRRRSLLRVVSGGRLGNPRKRSLSDNVIGTTTAGRVVRGAGVVGAAGLTTALLLRRGKGAIPVAKNIPVASSGALANRTATRIYPQPISQKRLALLPSSSALANRDATRIYPQPISQKRLALPPSASKKSRLSSIIGRAKEAKNRVKEKITNLIPSRSSVAPRYRNPDRTNIGGDNPLKNTRGRKRKGTYRLVSKSKKGKYREDVRR